MAARIMWPKWNFLFTESTSYANTNIDVYLCVFTYVCSKIKYKIDYTFIHVLSEQKYIHLNIPMKSFCIFRNPIRQPSELLSMWLFKDPASELGAQSPSPKAFWGLSLWWMTGIFFLLCKKRTLAETTKQSETITGMFFLSGKPGISHPQEKPWI